MNCGVDDSVGDAGLHPYVLQNTHASEAPLGESLLEDGAEISSTKDRSSEVREQWRALRELFKGSTQRDEMNAARVAAFSAAKAACSDVGIRLSPRSTRSTRCCSLHISRVSVRSAWLPRNKKGTALLGTAPSDTNSTPPPKVALLSHSERTVSALRSVLDVSLTQRRSEESHYSAWPALQRVLPRGLSFLEEIKYDAISANSPQTAEADPLEAGRSTPDGPPVAGMLSPRESFSARLEDEASLMENHLVSPPLGRLSKRTKFTVLRRGLPKFFDLSFHPLAAFLLHGVSQQLQEEMGLQRLEGDRSPHDLEALQSQVRDALKCCANSLGHSSSTDILSSYQVSRLLLENGDLKGRKDKALEVWVLEKLNGENAQISYSVELECWVVCSKLVTLLISFASSQPSVMSELSIHSTEQTHLNGGISPTFKAPAAHSPAPPRGTHEHTDDNLILKDIDGVVASLLFGEASLRAAPEMNLGTDASERSEQSSSRCTDRTFYARRVAAAWTALLDTLDSSKVSRSLAAEAEKETKFRRRGSWCWREDLYSSLLCAVPLESQVEELRRLLSGRTLVGELLGCLDRQHVVQPSCLGSLQSGLVFYALVPNDGSFPCYSPAVSLALLRSLSLPTAKVRYVLRPRSSIHLLCLLAHLQGEVVSQKETAEGVVLYFCFDENATPTAQQEESGRRVAFLVKLKSSRYLMRRLLRERLKSFILSSETDSCALRRALACLSSTDAKVFCHQALATLPSKSSSLPSFTQLRPEVFSERRIAAASSLGAGVWDLSRQERVTREFAFAASGVCKPVSPLLVKRLLRAFQTERRLHGQEWTPEAMQLCQDVEGLSQELFQLAETESRVFQRCAVYCFHLCVVAALAADASSSNLAPESSSQQWPLQQPLSSFSGVLPEPAFQAWMEAARRAVHDFADLRLHDVLKEAAFFAKKIAASQDSVFDIAGSVEKTEIEDLTRKRRARMHRGCGDTSERKALCVFQQQAEVHLVAQPCALSLSQLEDLRFRARQEGYKLRLHHGFCECGCLHTSIQAPRRSLIIFWGASPGRLCRSSEALREMKPECAAAWALSRRLAKAETEKERNAALPEIGLAFVSEDCRVVQKTSSFSQHSPTGSATEEDFGGRGEVADPIQQPIFLVLRSEMQASLAKARDAQEAAAVFALTCVSKCTRRCWSKTRSDADSSLVTAEGAAIDSAEGFQRREPSSRCFQEHREPQVESVILTEVLSSGGGEGERVKEWQTRAERFSLLLRDRAAKADSEEANSLSRQDGAKTSDVSPLSVMQVADCPSSLVVSLIVVLPVGIPGSGKTSILLQTVRPMIRHDLRLDGEEPAGGPTGFALWKCRSQQGTSHGDPRHASRNTEMRSEFSDVLYFASSDESTGFELRASGHSVQEGLLQRVFVEEAEASGHRALARLQRQELQVPKQEQAQFEKPSNEVFKKANRAAVQRMRQNMNFFFTHSLPTYLRHQAQELGGEGKNRNGEITRLRVLVVIDQNHTPKALPKRSADLTEILTWVQRRMQEEIGVKLTFALAPVVFGADACRDGSSLLVPDSPALSSKWTYPWSATALTFCIHRVFFRVGHPVLGGAGASSKLEEEMRELNVCLSFVKLFQGFNADLKEALERIPGIASVLHVHSIFPPSSMDRQSRESKFADDSLTEIGRLVAAALDNNMRPFVDNSQNDSLYLQILKGIKDLTSFNDTAALREASVECCAVELQSQLEGIFSSLESGMTATSEAKQHLHSDGPSNVRTSTCIESLGSGQRQQRNCGQTPGGGRIHNTAGTQKKHWNPSSCGSAKETIFLPRFIAVDMQDEARVLDSIAQQMHAAVANAQLGPSAPFPKRPIPHPHVTTCFFRVTSVTVNDHDKHRAQSWVDGLTKGNSDSAGRRNSSSYSFAHSSSAECTKCVRCGSGNMAVLTAFLASQRQLDMAFSFSVTHVVMSSFRGGILCAPVKPLDGAYPLPYSSDSQVNEANVNWPSCWPERLSGNSSTLGPAVPMPIFVSNNAFTHITLALGGTAQAKHSNDVIKAVAAAMQVAVEKGDLPRGTQLPFRVGTADIKQVSLQHEAPSLGEYAALRRGSVCDGEGKDLLFFDGVSVDGEVACMWVWCVPGNDQEIVTGKLAMFGDDGSQSNRRIRAARDSSV